MAPPFDPHAHWKQLQADGKLRTLKYGMDDPQVAMLRGALAYHGFGHLPGGARRYNLNTEFTKALRELVESFQFTHTDKDGKRLDKDGIVGPKTAWALAQKKREDQQPRTDGPPPGALRARYLLALHNEDLLNECRAKAKKKLRRGNACALTQSYLDIHVGLRKDLEDGAEEYCDALESWTGPRGERWVRIRGIHNVRRGDRVKCKDLTDTQKGGPPNGRADHVFTALSDCDSNGDVRCFDNNAPTGYVRNLDPGRKTPMDYALRLVG